MVKRQRKTIAVRLSLTRNRIWTPPGLTSFVELRFLPLRGCPEPLSLADGVGASALELFRRELGLEAIQSRCRR